MVFRGQLLLSLSASGLGLPPVRGVLEDATIREPDGGGFERVFACNVEVG
jgi:hypothetical protein